VRRCFEAGVDGPVVAGVRTAPDAADASRRCRIAWAVRRPTSPMARTVTASTINQDRRASEDRGWTCLATAQSLLAREMVLVTERAGQR
jgi:hypothetical protein